MDEVSRYAVGLDVGTSMVRAVVSSVNAQGKLNVIGYAEMPNSGMRRGAVANLAGPGQCIDKVLGEVERMGGYEVNSAVVSINGSKIVSVQTCGMIAVGAIEHEINESDLHRVEGVALQGRVSANQEILDVVPLEFVLDGQDGIKDPLGMTGSRLEMRANVVSTLASNFENLKRAAELANVTAERVVPSVVAAAKAVLNERQMENGVAVVDIGAATTGVAVYVESDLQYVAVIPVGSNNITNDLATILAVDVEVAEEIKRRFATGNFMDDSAGEQVTIRWRGKDLRFEKDKIDSVVQDRLDEMMSMIREKLKEAHYEQRLPEGIVLTGGGARMKDLDKFVRASLRMAVKIGVPSGLSGVAEAVYKPEYAAAVGLMQISAESEHKPMKKATKKGKATEKKPGFLKKFFGKF